MDDPGFGACPLGSVPFGYGAPAHLNSTAGKLYLDRFGVQHDAAAIDTVTGDLVRDPQTGLHMGMPSTEQAVYLALRTVLGSSIVRDLGVSFKGKTISATTQQKIQESVAAALEALVSRGLVQVVRVNVQRIKMTAIEVAITWKDLSDGATKTTKATNG